MISSIANSTIKRVRRLRKPMWRERTGRFLVEGHRPVETALEAGAPLEEILHTTTATRRRRSVLARAREAGIATVEVSDDVMAHLSSVATAPDVLGVAQLRAAADVPASLPAILLTGVHDPASAGGILAIAVASGIGTAIFGRTTVDPFDPKVVRAAQGAHFLLTIVRTKDDAAAIERLRAAGGQIVVLGDKGVPPWEVALAGTLALVVDGEDSVGGVVERVAVPTGPIGPSLAARSAVVMYEWRRQKEAANS